MLQLRIEEENTEEQYTVDMDLDRSTSHQIKEFCL